MELTAANVDAVMRDCLYKDDELPADGSPPEGFVKAAGVVSTFGFHPDRLAAHGDEIKSMLAQLPDTFRVDKGGGWSFLNACMRADGVQWGEHRDIDSLLCLGQAIGAASILLPRDLWNALPGGMPYFSVVV